MSVLFIDQDPLSIFLYKKIIEATAKEIEVSVCTDPMALPSMFSGFFEQQIFPDLILAGFSMPIEYEPEYLQSLIEMARYSKIVVLSAFLSDTEISILRKAGINDHLLKPLSVGKFSELLQHV